MPPNMRMATPISPTNFDRMSDDAQRVRDVIAWARQGLVDRESLVEVLALSAVAGEHVLVVGPPGTAKSLAVRRFSQALQGRYFEYLLGRFTEPNEVFGPVDLRKLREGAVEIETAGMLPEAQIAFLDEVFLGSTAILNTLLGLLNERVFRRGKTVMASDLLLCVGASNTLPDDPQLAAFADRFLVRVFVDPLPDSRLEDLLEHGWGAQQGDATLRVDDPMTALTNLAACATTTDLRGVRPMLGTALRTLRGAGIVITDRRAVKAQRLIAAAAALDGRQYALPLDLWPLPLIAPTLEAQALARDVLGSLLADAGSTALPHAAEELTRGPAARAERILQHGRALLAKADDSIDHRLKVEATLREIDASLRPEDLSIDLAAVRAQMIANLAPSP
jgi:MoxR-like ATPase